MAFFCFTVTQRITIYQITVRAIAGLSVSSLLLRLCRHGHEKTASPPDTDPLRCACGHSYPYRRTKNPPYTKYQKNETYLSIMLIRYELVAMRIFLRN